MTAVEIAVIGWMFGPCRSQRPMRDDIVAMVVREYLSEPYKLQAT